MTEPGWIPPERRIRLIRGAMPWNSAEKRYQSAIWAHRADRARKDDRRA